MKEFRLWVEIGLVVGALLVLGLNLSRPYQFRGSTIDPPEPAPEMALSATTGGGYSLEDSTGKIRLLFFGYTSCPDVCPITLGEIKGLIEALGDRGKEVQLLFVTVDPERDTVERLRKYLGAFHPSFIGLTGSLPELSKVWADYGVVRQVDASASSAGPLISHTARLYLIDRQGRLRLTYPFGTPVEDIRQDVLHLVSE